MKTEKVGKRKEGMEWIEYQIRSAPIRNLISVKNVNHDSILQFLSHRQLDMPVEKIHIIRRKPWVEERYLMSNIFRKESEK